MRLNNRGFSLLESVIAMAIFAIGFLAITSVQIKSSQLSGQMTQQMHAAVLTQDLVERVLINQQSLNSDGFFASAQENTACNGIGNPDNCTPNVLARHELHSWQLELIRQLPSASWTICRDSTPNDGTPAAYACEDNSDTDLPIAIKIWWQGPQDDSERRLSTSLTL